MGREKGVLGGWSPLKNSILEKEPPSRTKKVLIISYQPYGRGVSERQRRSAANRSPLPRPSVLDAPHWGAGPEPAGETLPPPLGEVARRSRVGRGKRGRVYSFGPLLRQARVATRPALDFPLGNE